MIGVGRVKTPTLAIVCRRELEIRDFVVQPYSEVVATATVATGQFRVRYAPKERIAERAVAEAVARLADGATGPLAVKVEEKRQSPPRLHDLPSLQKLCASRFGWSAAHTLEVAQELYDGSGKKIITYPRAETRYLPESLIDQVPHIIAGLRIGRSFAPIPVPNPPVIRRGMSGTFSDKGLAGASHHAMIPNHNTIETLREVWPRLNADERRLFDGDRPRLPRGDDAGLPLPANDGGAGRAGPSLPRCRPPTDRAGLASCLPGLAACRGEGRRGPAATGAPGW